MVEIDFTHQSYGALVQAFLDRGYAVTPYADAGPGEKHLILRHDIDMSLDAATPIAGIEHELGVSATYFVLVRSELYNPFAPDALSALRAIMDRGHRIGLHCDLALYADARAAEEGARREAAALEGWLDAPIDVISFHRPTGDVLGKKEKFAGRLSAYASRFFRDIGYCSDSRGGWHHGHPLQHPAVEGGRALQLLTHPIWWGEHGAAPAGRLREFLDARFARLDRELGAQCDVHVPRPAATRSGEQGS